jgi:hypothetical protein
MTLLLYALNVLTPVWRSFVPIPFKSFTFDNEKDDTEDLPTLQELKAAERGMPTRTEHEAEFLKYHCKHGHILMLRICAMGQQGILPVYLDKCNLPICLACIYGKQVKREWRTKPTKYSAPHNLTDPGQLVAVDILTSPTPGFIAQISGILTCACYMHAAVYVDVAAGYGYIHIQKCASEEETLTGKYSFKRHCQQFDVTVKAYHADNGIFTCTAWRDSCITQIQGLSFATVGAHHQIGVAGRRIRTLQAERHW